MQMPATICNCDASQEAQLPQLRLGLKCLLHVQCEAWQALSLPAILVGDGRLGGISATLSAQDSLNMRGHTTAAVVVSEVDGLNNAAALRRHLGSSPLGQPVPVLELPALPPAPDRC